MATDCTKLSDDALMDQYRAVHAEVDRRQAFRAIPGQIAAMTTQYVADGGNRSELAQAVEDAPEPEEKTTAPPPPPPTTDAASDRGPKDATPQVAASLGVRS